MMFRVWIQNASDLGRVILELNVTWMRQFDQELNLIRKKKSAIIDQLEFLPVERLNKFLIRKSIAGSMII